MVHGRESHYSSKKDGCSCGHCGPYNLKDELTRLRSMPRVIKGKEMKFPGRPAVLQQAFHRAGGRPDPDLHIHLENTPGRRTQKHGHVNEAAFYILDGTGYEIHDASATTAGRATWRSCT